MVFLVMFFSGVMLVRSMMCVVLCAGCGFVAVVFVVVIVVVVIGVSLGGWSSVISALVAVVMVVVVVCCAACGDITFGTSGDVDGEYGSNNGILSYMF